MKSKKKLAVVVSLVVAVGLVASGEAFAKKNGRNPSSSMPTILEYREVIEFSASDCTRMGSTQVLDCSKEIQGFVAIDTHGTPHPNNLSCLVIRPQGNAMVISPQDVCKFTVANDAAVVHDYHVNYRPAVLRVREAYNPATDTAPKVKVGGFYTRP